MRELATFSASFEFAVYESTTNSATGNFNRYFIEISLKFGRVSYISDRNSASGFSIFTNITTFVSMRPGTIFPSTQSTDRYYAIGYTSSATYPFVNYPCFGSFTSNEFVPIKQVGSNTAFTFGSVVSFGSLLDLGTDTRLTFRFWWCKFLYLVYLFGSSRTWINHFTSHLYWSRDIWICHVW